MCGIDEQLHRPMHQVAKLLGLIILFSWLVASGFDVDTSRCSGEKLVQCPLWDSHERGEEACLIL